MLRAVIRKGDKTTHGGTVLEGNERMTHLGLPVALRGHRTVCPQCKGEFPIAEGLDGYSVFGVGVALDGMKTACGAKLIASQQTLQVDDGG